MTDMTKQSFVLATRTSRTGTNWFIDADGNWTTYSREVATFPTEQAAREFRKEPYAWPANDPHHAKVVELTWQPK